MEMSRKEGPSGLRRGKETRDKAVVEATCFTFAPHSRQGWGEAWEALGPATPGRADGD